MKEFMKKNKIVIIAGLIWLLTIMNYIEFKVTLGDLFTLVGSFVGVLGAFWIATYQNRENIKKEVKEKEPKVLFGATNYREANFIVGYDFYEENLNKKRESNLTIPIINGGETNIYDIAINFKILNHNNYMLDYAKKSDSIKELKSKNPLFGGAMSLDIENDNILFKYNNGIRRGFKTLKLKSYVEGIPILSKQESLDINLPYTFAALIQYCAINVSYKNNSGKTIIKSPILESKIMYKDYLDEPQNKTVYTVAYIRKVSIKSSVNTIDITIRHFDKL